MNELVIINRIEGLEKLFPAERAIRPYVIWRKLIFASQSYQGDQFRPLILSIIGTAQRLDISSY